MPDSYPPLIEGNPASPVRLVIYEDLQCKDCAWLRRKLDEALLPVYADHVGFEHREFPLPNHTWARPAALAARFYQTVDLDLAVAFRREVLGACKDITPDTLPAWIETFAQRHNTVPAPSNAALAEAVEADYKSGLSRQVSRTPTLFLKEAAFIERIAMDQLTAALDAAVQERV